MDFQSVLPVLFYILTSHSHEEITDHFFLIIEATVNEKLIEQNVFYLIKSAETDKISNHTIKHEMVLIWFVF